MGKFRQLLVVEAAALAALALFAGAMAAVAASDSATNSAAILRPGSAAWVTFAYTCLLGAAPVILFGAPSYWLLLQKGRARWYYALVIGAAPALVFLVADLNLAFWALIAGSIVALLTHVLCRRLGPNNSSKPTPLRGAA
jgi:hypothetical protein